MIKDKLLNLLKAGRITEALEQLLLITESRDKASYNDLILLSARLNANNSMFNKGLLNYEQLKIENSRIFDAVISHIESIAEADYFQFLSPADLENSPAVPGEEMVKVLFIASNPIGTPKFQLEKEYLEMRRIFQDKRTKFDITESFNTSLEQFFEVVRREQPDILHIAAPSNDRYLIFHRPDDTIKSASYDLLAAAFTLFQPYVRCVFMNTWCPPVFLKKISAPLRYAIGSRALVDDNMSVLFSSGFYTAVSQGKSFEEAFGIGVEVLRNSEQFAGSEIPFVLFKDGLSTDDYDQTPEDFDFPEPADLWGQPEEE